MGEQCQLPSITGLQLGGSGTCKLHHWHTTGDCCWYGVVQWWWCGAYWVASSTCNFTTIETNNNQLHTTLHTPNPPRTTLISASVPLYLPPYALPLCIYLPKRGLQPDNRSL